MKTLLLIATLFFFSCSTFATETFAYFIYVQTTYVQGFWPRQDLLNPDTYAYLVNKQFEDLFSISGEGEDMAVAMVGHLKDENPGRYSFEYEIKALKGVVTFKTKTSIPDFDIVKNELTATLVLNGFTAVKIVQGKTSKTYKLNDISVPYMDLVAPPKQ